MKKEIENLSLDDLASWGGFSIMLMVMTAMLIGRNFTLSDSLWSFLLVIPLILFMIPLSKFDRRYYRLKWGLSKNA